MGCGIMDIPEQTWLVCGGRDFGKIPRRSDPLYEAKWAERRFVMAELQRIYGTQAWYQDERGHYQPLKITIIAGGASGVDEIAVFWAITNWCEHKEYRAKWTEEGKAAGPRRNQRMLDEGKPSLVIAFPGGKGTANMIRLAEQAGVETLIVPYEQAGDTVHCP